MAKRTNEKDVRRPEDWFSPVPPPTAIVSGTNTGDQTSIVGISGTKAQFNTALTDGDFLYVGDITQYTDEMSRDALGIALVAGANITITVNDVADTITIAAAAGGSISDGDKGDITVSGSGATWTIDNDAVTYAKMQNVSATSRILGRKTAAAGDAEECTLSEVLDFIGSAAQGDILYRGASAWSRLAAGTSGQFLKTNGAGADPAWAGSGNETLIQKLSLAGVSTVSFTGIPATYDAILIYINAAGAAFTGIRANNDASALYQCQRTGYANGTINLQSLTQTQWVMGASLGNNYKMTGNLISYADTTDSKMLNLIGTSGYGVGGGGLGSGNLMQFEISGLWGPAAPAAINRLDFNFAAAVTRGFVALYGRNF